MNEQTTTTQPMTTKKVVGIAAGTFLVLSLAGAAVRKVSEYFTAPKAVEAPKA